jgi:PleD family two-component response regulator
MRVVTCWISAKNSRVVCSSYKGTEAIIMEKISPSDNILPPVLIVEDNLLMRKILEGYLRELGYMVVAAENGRQALELMGEKYFPIVITDWVMPEMDGRELCRTIRSSNNPGYV